MKSDLQMAGRKGTSAQEHKNAKQSYDCRLSLHILCEMTAAVKSQYV